MSGPDCISVVVLKNYEFELSHTLADLFNMFLKEQPFPDCWKVSSVVLVFNMSGRALWLKATILLAFFLLLVRSLKKIVNNWLLHDLGECDLYPFALDDLGESGLKPFAPNAPFLYPLKT